MERFLELLTSFLREAALCAVIELFISISYETPMVSVGELIIYPVLPKLTTCRHEAVVYSMYGLSLYWMYEFFCAFSKLPLSSRRESILRSLSYGFISANDYNQGFYDDWWDIKYLFVISMHYLSMVALCCFIALSTLCGLMIQSHLPTWKILFRPASICSAWVCDVLGLIGQAMRIGQSALLCFLDWFLYEDPISLIVSSTGLIISDILSAIWATSALVPTQFSTRLGASTIISGSPDDSVALAWYWKDVIPSHSWKSYIVEWLGVTLQPYRIGFSKWYSNRFEDDKLHHFPLLTIPVAMGLVFYACKLLWEDKPRRLVKIERIVEETLLNHAVIHDYESHLSRSMNKTDEFMQILAAQSQSLADALTQRKKMLNQYKTLEVAVEKSCSNVSAQGQRFQQFVKENMALHRENEDLQRRYLRLANDLEGQKEKIQLLNTQLAASNDENSNLHQQKIELKHKLDYMREAKLAADSMVTAAEKKAALEVSMLRQQKAELKEQFNNINKAKSAADATTTEVEKKAASEISKLNEDMEMLRQENATIQQTYQELLRERQVLVEAKSVAEDTVRSYASEIESLRISSQTSQEESQFLQVKIAEFEAELMARSQIAEEAVRHLHTETANLNDQYNAKAKELESMKTREDYTKKVNRNRDIQMRKLHRLRQKKVLIMKHTFMTHQQRLSMDIESVRKDNQRLEHRLVQLDPTLIGHTQVIHDQRKDNEVQQLRQQLQQQRARNLVLDGEVKRLEDENVQFRTRAAATGPSMAIDPQLESAFSTSTSSATREISDSDHVVTLRNELRSKDEEIQRLQIQLSNAKLARKGTGSNPFMPSSHGRGRGQGT
ncbi:hypothetical protein UA08_08515 [Talaromyces atroroseus]|uniref:Uncharacterized protein n=1 Tax=Talaromyces atroroseus TaxID=1441469 RepID=A0A1Q5Q829_TALAT|nr:hypothetical protein UA08_08515 [Talaromyces atroroseus]OKL56363.1 hypothetical protein UA08_08515 [Talaromyces atroroseus]